MERSLAIKKLGKILGKNMGYRVDHDGLLREDREKAAGEAKTLQAQYQLAAKAAVDRMNAVLDSDAEYQRLKAETKRLRREKDEAFSRSQHFRFTVGVSNSMFFHIKAQGDSWEEVLENLGQGENKNR